MAILLKRTKRPPRPDPAAAIRKMMGQRGRELHTVYKVKVRFTGSPVGDFDAWVESGFSHHSLPLVIRGQAGFFNGAGQWTKESDRC